MRTSNRLLVAMGVLVASLSGARPLYASEELDDILERSGQSVERFWSDFTRVTCEEQVSQFKLNEKGEVLVERATTFEYVMVMEILGERLRVEESRVETDDSFRRLKKDPMDPLMVTNGFSTMLLVFHPYFRKSYAFSLSDDEPDEQGVRRIRFEAIPGQPTPAALRLHGRDYPIEWKGSAWLDQTTGVIFRIETDLRNSMAGLGLTRLHAEAEYDQRTFSDTTSVFWLPSTARVEAETERQRWRNVHEFSNYRLFSVEINVEPTVGQ